MASKEGAAFVMKQHQPALRRLAAALCLCLCLGLLSSCARKGLDITAGTETAQPVSRWLRVVDDEPDTVDFQCTTTYYTVALNVFDRLVDTDTAPDGSSRIVPALAESWYVSGDGLVYTFRLRSGVSFSNGDPLTPEDVRYTLVRLLTHPQGRNREIAASILGAEALSRGAANDLVGFSILDENSFTIRLVAPFPAFLAALSTPAASILNEESTRAAGEAFGTDPAWIVGTGSFILESWEPSAGMMLRANPDCWRGAPACDGVELLFMTDEVEQRLMFERGELDILNLEDLGDEAEYFIHGDIYQDRLHAARQTSLTYLALNQSVKPLDDVRVRRALQLALDRQMILDAVYSGRGIVENGIFPHGLKGYNPDLEPIPYDPVEAKALLERAGHGDGFDLEITVNGNAGAKVRELVRLAASMWNEIGVRTKITYLPWNEFITQRETGKIACYPGTWAADYDDPDNFIYTFFGSRQNATRRSLCYTDSGVISRVYYARFIHDDAERAQEYAALEQKIVREDAAWIPLFSPTALYVTSERIIHFETAWNGWCQPVFRRDALKTE